MSHLEDRVDLFPQITDPRKNAYLNALAIHGKRGQAAEDAGVNRATPYGPVWVNDVHFKEAQARAEFIAAYALEDEARRRAKDGLRKYKHGKDGAPLIHPDECECEHARRDHLKPAVGQRVTGPCLREGCDCVTFQGRPYFEHMYSDTLLIFLLKGAIPEKYKDRIEVKGALANLDLTKLPNHLLDRIAKGEHPLEVLASAAPPLELKAGEGSGGGTPPDGDHP